MIDPRIVLVIEHGPMQDDFSPEWVKAVVPADAPHDMENLPNGMQLVDYRVVQELENEIERLKSVPVIFDIPEKELFFGLNCQMEDPSDDEENGFYSGAAWAQRWLIHSKRAKSPRLHDNGELTFDGARQLLDLLASNGFRGNTKTKLTLILAHYGDVDRINAMSKWTDSDIVNLKLPEIEAKLYVFVRDNTELFRKPQPSL